MSKKILRYFGWLLFLGVALEVPILPNLDLAAFGDSRLQDSSGVCAAAPIAFVPVEGRLTAAGVCENAVLLNWTADETRTLSGFYVRLANCVPPREKPTVVSISAGGRKLLESVEIPAFPAPLVHWTRPCVHSSETPPPLDVAREFRIALSEPLVVRKGENVRLEIVSSEELKSGVVGGLQFEGKYELATFRNPFRDARTNGPVCRIPWSEPEIVAVGTQKKFDPLCAPQNNSSVAADDDGTLYQFVAYYSVDEQYGGGRGGSFSRIFGYKKATNADRWEPLGLVVDLLENATYSGDPFIFRDLDGTPTLAFTTCDGTNGFEDWKLIGAYVVRSKTKSFAGPWGEPTPLWRDYPREPDDNKTGGRANCLRIFPRPKTGDYLVAWNHGARDMDVRAVVVPTLDEEISHTQINNAPILVKNQEEGGGGFALGDKGYYSTWQIPGINDPNGVQRLYEIDLSDPLNPESWRVVPGSLGFNDGANPSVDGGCTVDAWAVSVVGNELFATACEYSKTDGLNRLTVRRAPFDPTKGFEQFGCERLETSNSFRYGAVRSNSYFETFPTIEYAIGQNCAIEFNFRSEGTLSYAFAAIGPSDAPGASRSVFFEVNPEGAFFVAYKNDAAKRIVLAENREQTWKPGERYRLKFVRRENRLIGSVDGRQILAVEIADAEILANLDDAPRFKLYGWQGGTYEIKNAVLTDGE